MIKKDCFDACTITACPNCGHDVAPFEVCLQDPIIDRYVKHNRRGVKKPCNTCGDWQEEVSCLRCIHRDI